MMTWLFLGLGLILLVAGADLLVKRFAKTIDPKLTSEADESPALQAANQQIQAMGQEMEQMHQMIQNFSKSIEVQEQIRKDFESQIKAYQAETQRISATAAGMTEEQIQDIVMGTIAAALDTGDLIGGAPHREMPNEMMEAPEAVQEPGEMNEML